MARWMRTCAPKSTAIWRPAKSAPPILDSTRNVVVLMADNRAFELPAGFSSRLHARLERELAEP